MLQIQIKFIVIDQLKDEYKTMRRTYCFLLLITTKLQAVLRNVMFASTFGFPRVVR